MKPYARDRPADCVHKKGPLKEPGRHYLAHAPLPTTIGLAIECGISSLSAFSVPAANFPELRGGERLILHRLKFGCPRNEVMYDITLSDISSLVPGTVHSSGN